MGFFRNLVNKNLVSDDFKQEIAQSFYDNNKELSKDDVRAILAKTEIVLEPDNIEFLEKILHQQLSRKYFNPHLKIRRFVAGNGN